MKSKKVILDTNLWISFLISKNYSFLDNYVENGKVKLIFSKELFTEFITVAERPKFTKFFSPKDIKKLISYIDKFGILYQVTSDIKDCRDIKDSYRQARPRHRSFPTWSVRPRSGNQSLRTIRNSMSRICPSGDFASPDHPKNNRTKHEE